MFCSNCGQNLGAVAHIVNNELLCENCYLKVSHGLPSDASHTVALGLANDEERRVASQSIEEPPEAGQGQPAQQQSPPKPTDETSIISKFLAPGETLLWKRSFSKGVINRHLTYTEFVSNTKALCIDDEHGTPVKCVLLRDAVIAVNHERRDYSGTRTGYGRYGSYVGTSSGHSTTMGDLDFMVQGKIGLTLFNVRDPHGLKHLVEAAIKSSKTMR